MVRARVLARAAAILVILRKAASVKDNFPTTRIEKYEVSRLLCGTNTFYGDSHFSHAKDVWLRRYFTQERIVEVMCRFAEHGVNGVVSIPRPDLKAAIDEVERRTGVHMLTFATPGGEDEDDLMDGVRLSRDLGCEFCLPHTGYTDQRIVAAERCLVGFDRALPLIRQCGMVPGLSTHRPEAITVGDAGNYDLATYIQPYNPIGFLCSIETDWLSHIIRQTRKPVIIIKPLGAGRVMPPTGLRFVYSTIKPIDTVCIGTMSPEEVDEDVRIALEYMTGQPASVQLQWTRSKKALEGA